MWLMKVLLGEGCMIGRRLEEVMEDRRLEGWRRGESRPGQASTTVGSEVVMVLEWRMVWLEFCR